MLDIILIAVGVGCFAIAIAYTPAISRLARGLVLDLRNREFIAAARMRGEP